MFNIRPRTIITLTIVGGWIFMLVLGREVPEQLTLMVYSLISYWFGEKGGTNALKILNAKNPNP